MTDTLRVYEEKFELLLSRNDLKRFLFGHPDFPVWLKGLKGLKICKDWQMGCISSISYLLIYQSMKNDLILKSFTPSFAFSFSLNESLQWK